MKHKRVLESHCILYVVIHYKKLTVVITFYSTSDSPLTRCISIPHDGIYIRGTGAILIDFFGFDTFT